MKPRTRAGSKVVVFGGIGFHIFGAYEIQGEYIPVRWDSEGYYDKEVGNTALDLIYESMDTEEKTDKSPEETKG